MAESDLVRPGKSDNVQRPRYFSHSKDHHNIHKKSIKTDNRDFAIYVSNESNIKALLSTCDKLIKNDHQEIIIYCMGSAIQRGILLALQVCEKHVAFQVSTNTSTVEYLDESEPMTDDADYEFTKRNNSAVRIRVFRSFPTPQ